MNSARYLFLDERAKDFYLDSETSAREAVSALRLLAGQDPSDKALMALVGELATRSSDFRTWWGGHTVRVDNSGTKRIKHPLVGEMTLSYESIIIPSNTGIVIATYLAEPGTPLPTRSTSSAAGAPNPSARLPTGRRSAERTQRRLAASRKRRRQTLQTTA